MSLDPPARYRFGDFVLDVGRYELRRRDRRVRLERQPMDLLILLVEREGQLVPRDAIVDRLWGRDVFVEVETGIHKAVLKIRQALGDSADRARFIETVPGKGYRFVAPIERVPVPAASVAAHEPEPPPAATGPTSRRASALLVIAAAVAVVLIVAGVRRTPFGQPRVSPHETLDSDARQALQDASAILAASRSQVELQRARRMLESAVERDPRFAAAHAALANTLAILTAFGVEPPANLLPRGREHADRAIQLDPTLAAGWQALGHIQVHWDRDWQGAERSYRQALALDPHGEFNFLFTHLLAALGRFEEAIAEADRAIASAPGAAPVLGSNCVVLYLARRYDEALRTCDEALERQPDYNQAQFWRAQVLVELGRVDEAMQAAVAAARPMANSPAWVVGYVHARAGRTDEARAVLQTLEQLADTSYVPPTDLAFLHAALGHDERALDWLTRGLSERSRRIHLLAVDPAADSLRHHPRFGDLLKGLGLPDGVVFVPPQS